jgi:hypothetical protein
VNQYLKYLVESDHRYLGMATCLGCRSVVTALDGDPIRIVTWTHGMEAIERAFALVRIGNYRLTYRGYPLHECDS